ncbi:hypothetical protein GGX14DRAFT_343660 [Mycena pura]|uniref:F-box domain-containing protein n=1 Tax=Mycena pura TaxID=153505 RepID=A0AAD7E5S7_9AGAR|nr:hypothetical protein GGX14DRAFT_343660 [Mycena pura]
MSSNPSVEELACAWYWGSTLGTRYHQLMHSNEPPLEADLTVVNLAISAIDTRLSSLDDEITCLNVIKARLELLEEERHTFATRRKQNLAIFSPLRRMPAEVLAEIFLLTLPPAYVRQRGTFRIAKSPWVSTFVCSRWRAVS